MCRSFKQNSFIWLNVLLQQSIMSTNCIKHITTDAGMAVSPTAAEPLIDHDAIEETCSVFDRKKLSPPWSHYTIATPVTVTSSLPAITHS